MTTYGALTSLQNTIDHIIHSSRISLVGHSQEVIFLAYKALQPLKEILERLDNTSKSRSRKKVNALDLQIKERVREFEDLLESHLAKQIRSQSGSSQDRDERDALVFSIDLQGLKGDAGSLIRTLMDMEEEYIYQLNNMAEDNEASSSIIGFGGTNSKMIGLWDELEDVKQNLLREFFGKDVFVLVGMAGVGKTALAQQIYQDPQIVSKFECRAWVTIGRKPQHSQLPKHILAQLVEGDAKVGERRLEGKKCLVVLDDVWEREALDYLINNLPAYKNGFIQILVTARERNEIINITSVDSFYNLPDVVSPTFKVVRFLNEVESKDLLCEKVFGEPVCPYQLDKAATKIAKKCEGLPLTILTVADILVKSHRRDDPNYWDDVAEERNSVFTDAYNEMTKVFFPSYDHLPQFLKMPFLYKGVFPRGYDFPPSKIMNMLTAEDWFFHTNKMQSLEVTVWECLHELCTSKNLVLFNKKSIFWHEKTSYYRMYKICWLHSTWRHVCRGEARKNKFYQVLKKLVDGSEEGIKGHRCLCLENNILFGIKGFCNSVKLNYIRSVLFLGPYHQYPIPVDVGFILLRELDALKLRFYTFPTEILALFHLKYLALTCNGQLPATISKLFNLQVLIVHPHVNITHFDDPSYVPIQIWDMQKLEHIEILGKSLLPPHGVASLKKLLTVVGVNANIATILELSGRIPSIRKLGIRIELRPSDGHNDLISCFRSISTLESLETLKCCIINPVIQHGYRFPATPSSLMMPRGLIKLHLSGMGFPWKYMDIIGSNLPFLRVLKLRSYAFLGSQWDAQVASFLRLDFLLIEDSDLMYLRLRSESFPKLSYLSMKHCYKIKEICWPPPSDLRHRKIELVDCNRAALLCALDFLESHITILDVIVSTTFQQKPVTKKFKRIIMRGLMTMMRLLTRMLMEIWPERVMEWDGIPYLSDEEEYEDRDGDSAERVEQRDSIPDLSDEGKDQDNSITVMTDGVEERDKFLKGGCGRSIVEYKGLDQGNRIKDLAYGVVERDMFFKGGCGRSIINQGYKGLNQYNSSIKYLAFGVLERDKFFEGGCSIIYLGYEGEDGDSDGNSANRGEEDEGKSW